MAMLSNMKIGMRLVLGFGLMLVLMLLVAWLGFARLQEVQGRLEQVSSSTLLKIKLANTMRDSIRGSANSVRNLALLIDEDPIEKDLERIVNERKNYDAASKQLNEIEDSEAGKALLTRIGAARQKSAPLIEKILVLTKEQKNAEGTALWRAELRPEEAKWLTALEDLVRLQEEAAAADAAKAQATYTGTVRLLALLVLLSLGAGAGLAVAIIRSITAPLNNALQISNAVAAGDLSVEIDGRGGSETSLLLTALGEMRDRLSETVGGVRRSAEGVATASAEISTGNNDLSMRTERQASTIEETSASMEEMNGTLKQIAESASNANRLAVEASSSARKGGDVVGEVVGTMREINESSKRISDIIGVIDGIAFQTNILALNAAVEAARAGEQGRGFAVVASEVRSLAQRSAGAAKEIKGLIGSSVERVERGCVLVDQAGAAMEEIVGSVKHVADLIGEVSRATVEQSAGIGQISQAVVDMDKTTQQNAALVEQSAAAAESLKGQAQQLVDAVAVFKLSDRR